MFDENTKNNIKELIRSDIYLYNIEKLLTRPNMKDNDQIDKKRFLILYLYEF